MAETLNKAFGKVLQRLRNDRTLTRKKLAELSGLSVDGIRKLEVGEFSPSLETLNALSKGLDLRLVELVAFIESSEPVEQDPP